jgi:hypothetical protein
MRYRVVMWTGAGFLVAGCWALYFAKTSRDNPIEPIVYTLARLTCPIAIAGSHFPLSVNWTLLANAATYALVGLILETLRQPLNHTN